MGIIFQELYSCGYKIWQRGYIIRIYINDLSDLLDYNIDENNLVIEGVDYSALNLNCSIIMQLISNCSNSNLYIDINDNYHFDYEILDVELANIFDISISKMMQRLLQQL